MRARMGKSLPKQAILVVNAGSRRGADLFAEARDKLTAAGIELLSAKKCKTAKSMETAIKQAREHETRKVAARAEELVSH